MPAITPGSKILVTGANGYVAVWVVKTLLERGFSVRATVRSESKAGHLNSLFSSYGDKYETVVVEDITKDGAFDEAVKGVDAIAHTASPFHMNAVEPDELTIPAIRGTVGVMKSAQKYGSNVKRIVVTGSTASILTAIDPKDVAAEDYKTRVFTETDWNEGSVKQTSELGRDADGMTKYRASKTLAEKAAWKFLEDNSDLKFDLVVLNPPFVFGPAIQELTSADQLNTSLKDFYNNIVKAKPLADAEEESKYLKSISTGGGAWVDARDLGLAHSLALEKEAAGGERIIITEGPFVWHDWISSANEIDPPIYENLRKGSDSYVVGSAKYTMMYDSSKGKRILGLGAEHKYTTKEASAKAMLEDFKARGW